MSKPFVIDIISQKGGVGKTTLTISLAVYLASYLHLRILILDLDPQGHVAVGFGKNRDDGMYQWIVKGQSIESVSKKINEYLYIVSNDQSNLYIEEHINRASFREYILNDLIQQIDGFDIIILDNSPSSTSVMHIMGLVASTHILIPVTMDYLSLDGMVHVLKTVHTLTNYPNIVAPTILGCVPFMFERKTSETLTNLVELQKLVGPSLIMPFVPRDTHVREASSRGMTIWDYCPNSPAVIGVIGKSTVINSRGRIGGLLHVGEQVVDKLHLERK
jgi:chromosome partitioning protein